MLISLVKKGSDSEKDGQATGSKAVCRFFYRKGRRGREGRQEQKGDKSKFSIPGLAKYEDGLNLAQFRTFSFHYPSRDPQSKQRKGEMQKRLQGETFPGNHLGY